MKLGPFGVAPESETPGWTHRRIKCVLPGDSLSVKADSFLTVEMRERETHRPKDIDTDTGTGTDTDKADERILVACKHTRE